MGIRAFELERTGSWIAPIAVAIFALFVRVVLVHYTDFDGLYGQDPFAYIDYAAAFKIALAHGQLPPPFFWPIGYPALAAVLSTLLPLGLAAQIVSVASGVLVAVLICLIAREILGNQPHALIASLFAGVMIASAGQLLISSVCTMSDAASLFAATLSAFGMIRFHRTRALRWIALAGLALGWAVTTRWVYALLIPVWGIALVAEERSARIFLRDAIIWFTFFVFALLPQGLLIADQARRGVIAFVGDAQVYSWDLGNMFRSDIVNADGHFKYLWSIGNYYSLPLIEPDYVPIWFTPLLFLGVWALRRRRGELILLLGWFAMMWSLLIGVEWENWRFPLAFFPPLTLLAAVGLHELFNRIPQSSARLMGGWFAIGLVVMLVWGLRDADSFIQHQLDERAVVSWTAAQVPADATILTFGETANFEHFTSFRVVEMAVETPGSVEQIARAGRDVFVMLNVGNVESQWQGLAPQVNFQAIQDHFVVRQFASRGAYILYSVGNSR